MRRRQDCLKEARQDAIDDAVIGRIGRLIWKFVNELFHELERPDDLLGIAGLDPGPEDPRQSDEGRASARLALIVPEHPKVVVELGSVRLGAKLADTAR
jgi:hypothetical protein